eukprot:8153288-Alexandrium_andersonii.AAC.1
MRPGSRARRRERWRRASGRARHSRTSPRCRGRGAGGPPTRMPRGHRRFRARPSHGRSQCDGALRRPRTSRERCWKSM